MKQLQVLSIALLALGVCGMNAENFKEVKNSFILAYSNSSDTDIDPFTDQNATPTPAEKAIKGKVQPKANQTDADSSTSDPETEDLNNGATDSDDDS